MKKRLLTFLLLLMNGELVSESQKKYETAIFAGGCFWCMEPPFEKLDGIIDVIAGYTGGTGQNPTYQDYAKKGHVEAVQISYDPQKISYKNLLDIFWRNIDPTDPTGQFIDRGKQYRSVIFYLSDEQKKAAEESKQQLEKSKRFPKPIVTEIIKASTFWPAEEYHQDYYKKRPIRYKVYRFGSGRDRFLQKYWASKTTHSLRPFDKTQGRLPLNSKEGPLVPKLARDQGERSKKTARGDPSSALKLLGTKGPFEGARPELVEWVEPFEHKKYSKPSDAELRKKLTSLQYAVTQQNKTEKPYDNEYWDNKKSGIYVDIVSGEPLFSSLDKYDSKTGWPSFTKPLVPENIVEKTEWSLLLGKRIEVRSKHADSHLGHVFDDGPKPTGLRYCINSAALRFIPVEDLQKEGYGQFQRLFMI